jgi:hypothetical protein
MYKNTPLVTTKKLATELHKRNLNISPLHKTWLGQVPVAHAYNPSYSGGRDQEDHGSKPA